VQRPVLPPLDLPTLIEYGHRLAAALVSILVIAVAGYSFWLRRETGNEKGETPPTPRPTTVGYVALGLLALQVALGAITVKTGLTPTMVVLHLATAMLLLGVLLVAARGSRLTPGTPGLRPGSAVPLGLGSITVLLGALTANLGAATACLGFPLCDGQLVPAGDSLQGIHWAHRLLAYTLTVYVAVWALRTRRRGPLVLLGLVAVQVAIAAAMVLLALPGPLQAAHVAVGTAVWAGLVLVALPPGAKPT